MVTLDRKTLARWQADPAAFIETVLYDPETGRPFVLLPAEREFLKHAFRTGPNGRLLYPEQVYACPKKSGKTGFAALHMLTTILLFGAKFAEGYALANDQEQAQSRVFEALRRARCCGARRRSQRTRSRSRRSPTPRSARSRATTRAPPEPIRSFHASTSCGRTAPSGRGGCSTRWRCRRRGGSRVD
jgi:hypothetical protein